MKAYHAPENVIVYLGRHMRTSGGKKYRVREATFHPGWEKTKTETSSRWEDLAFDLLLLRLDRAVIFTPTISPVCLPNVLEDRVAESYEFKSGGVNLLTNNNLEYSRRFKKTYEKRTLNKKRKNRTKVRKTISIEN